MEFQSSNIELQSCPRELDAQLNHVPWCMYFAN